MLDEKGIDQMSLVLTFFAGAAALDTNVSI